MDISAAASKPSINKRLFYDELSPKDAFGLVIGLVILFAAFLTVPMLSLDQNEAYKILKKFYDENCITYTIIVTIFDFAIVFGIYYVIKIWYIKKYKNFLYLDEVYAKYEAFLSGAKEVFIFAGDLSFLTESAIQLKLIKKLGSKCNILCERLDQNPDEKKLVPLYKELYESKVKIRSYPLDVGKSLKKFRGQIRVDASQVRKSLFMQKNGDNDFSPIDIGNQYVTDLILKEFEATFKNGRNPIIKYIIFDLGGVYFKGDFDEDFLKPVNNMLKTKKIKNERNFKLVLDKGLNLGKCDITDWVQRNIPRSLTDEEKEAIKDKWANTWYPHPQMVKLAEALSHDYSLCVMSNLDRENGEAYIEKGYLSIFQTRSFLSYQMGITKPDPDLYKEMLKRLDAEAYQCLLIDDHETNIMVAKDLGFNTIQFQNKTDNIQKLIDLLKDIDIHVNIKE